MGIWILFSSVAMVVAIVGCASIRRFDRPRAEAISHDKSRYESRQPLGARVGIGRVGLG